jgi:hypothetical protein
MKQIINVIPRNTKWMLGAATLFGIGLLFAGHAKPQGTPTPQSSQVCCEYTDAGRVHHERCSSQTCSQFGGHAVDNSKCN